MFGDLQRHVAVQCGRGNDTWVVKQYCLGLWGDGCDIVNSDLLLSLTNLFNSSCGFLDAKYHDLQRGGAVVCQRFFQVTTSTRQANLTQSDVAASMQQANAIIRDQCDSVLKRDEMIFGGSLVAFLAALILLVILCALGCYCLGGESLIFASEGAVKQKLNDEEESISSEPTTDGDTEDSPLLAKNNQAVASYSATDSDDSVLAAANEGVDDTFVTIDLNA